MFKRSKFIVFVMLVLMSSTGLLFQNCSADFSSLAMKANIERLSSTVSLEVDDELETPVEISKVETSYQPILVDRYYLKSLFENIFGPTASDVDSQKLFVDFQTNGSPCSIYGDHWRLKNDKGDKENAAPMELCSFQSPDRLTAAVNPLPTVTRQAKIVRACSDLTTNATTLAFALKKISSVAVPSATDENVKAAFELFYRNNLNPDQAVIDSLRLMLTSGAPTTDDWRSVLYTICMSPQWQVI